MPALKQIALKSIKNGFQECDIIRETFSTFTSRCTRIVSFPILLALTCIRRYSEIRTIQVNHLLGLWLSGNEKVSKAIREKLDEKIECYAAGKLDHAVDAILSIWEISNKEEVAPSPSVAPPNTSWFGSLFRFNVPDFAGYDMRPSLVKSIQEASLLDRKYWARRSRGGKIEPVYFPSTVPETELRGLDACESPRSGDGVRY